MSSMNAGHSPLDIVGRFRLLCYLVNKAVCQSDASGDGDIIKRIQMHAEHSGSLRFIQRNLSSLLEHGYPAHALCSLPDVKFEMVHLLLEPFVRDTQPYHLQQMNQGLGTFSLRPVDLAKRLHSPIDADRLEQVLKKVL